MCGVIGISDSLRVTRSCEDVVAYMRIWSTKDKKGNLKATFITSDTCFHSYLSLQGSECAGNCRLPRRLGKRSNGCQKTRQSYWIYLLARNQSSSLAGIGNLNEVSNCSPIATLLTTDNAFTSRGIVVTSSRRLLAGVLIKIQI